MGWEDVSEINKPYHDFAWGFRAAGHYVVFVFKTHAQSMQMQWVGDNGFISPRAAPDDLEEAKAVALALYRMNGGGPWTD